MNKPDFTADRARLASLVASGDRAAVDELLEQLHVTYHDRPGDHVRVHLAWARVHLDRRAYVRAAFHAVTGVLVAGPVSLLQRHTGLVVPAFDAERAS